MPERRKYAIGPELGEAGVSFRIWAPERKSIALVLEGNIEIALTKEIGGYFSIDTQRAQAGMSYGFRVDGAEKLYPDPASHYQPEGPHGLSQIVDHRLFEWSDKAWKGISPRGQVLYEMHLGTFTEEGTWASARRHLPYLKELGITCIEMMPVADFPGRWGWGYDGVNLFAPTRLYGGPDDLKQFIDDAHDNQLGVILDVVYNHFGPDGNYLAAFSHAYLSNKHKNDWGQSINFDGPACEGVREFFISNALYWIREFHFDGFRFDATQAVIDDSKEHILAAVTREARTAAGDRDIYIICENEPQDTKLARPAEQSGQGMDSLWNDDFHHSAMVVLSGRNEAYYCDYLGQPQEFISAVKWGYLYQGQFYRWKQQRRGTPGLDLPPTAFVHYIQNHDQIANSGHGYRAHELSGLPLFRAMSALLLLSPQTPLLFQGQEYGAHNRFLYFADHNERLAALIRKGRVKELSQFASIARPEMLASLTDPGGRGTFMACKLDIAEHQRPANQWIFRLHRDLLRMRREEKAFARVQQRGDIDGAVLGPQAFLLRYFTTDGDDRLLIVNFDRDLHLTVAPEPLLAPPPGKSWEVMWSSEHPDYGGSGTADLETQGEDWRLPGENWTLPGRCAVVLRPGAYREGKFAGPKMVGLEEHELQ